MALDDVIAQLQSGGALSELPMDQSGFWGRGIVTDVEERVGGEV